MGHAQIPWAPCPSPFWGWMYFLATWVSLLRPPPCPTQAARLEGHCLPWGTSTFTAPKHGSPCNLALFPWGGGPFPDLSHWEFPTRGVGVVSSHARRLWAGQVMREAKPETWLKRGRFSHTNHPRLHILDHLILCAQWWFLFHCCYGGLGFFPPSATPSASACSGLCFTSNSHFT